VRPPLPLAAISAKLIMMSAPVRRGPQRNFPPSGEVASCDSRKAKWVVNWGARKPSWILEATVLVIGRMKNGTGDFLIAIVLGQQGCHLRKQI